MCGLLRVDPLSIDQAACWASISVLTTTESIISATILCLALGRLVMAASGLVKASAPISELQVFG